MSLEQTGLIVRNDAALQVAISDTALALKQAALEVSALIGRVSTPHEQEDAVRAQVEIKRVMDMFEKARVIAKKPVLDYGKAIDQTVKPHLEELDKEGLRVAMLVGGFQEKERMRIEAETRLQEQKQTDLERQRDEMLSKAVSVEEADAIREDFSQRAAEVSGQPIAPARVAGQSVSQEWEINVTNLNALYMRHPQCVKLEPRLIEIKQLLNAGVTLAGVEAKRVTKAGVRLNAQPKEIAV